MVIGKPALEKLAKKALAPEVDDYRGLTMPSGGAILVYIADGQEVYDVIDTIIHESVHVFEAVAKHMNEEHIGEEFRAYTTAHIATTLIKEYHALHEKWQAGLQAGECPVQQPTGAAESSLGTDNGSQ